MENVKTIHLTLTGPYAGTPYCQQPRNEEHRYIHAPQAPYEKWGFKEALCEQCRDLFLECLNEGWT